MKDILHRGVAEVTLRSHLERALRSKKKLRVKLGIDPTAPDLHLGHAVVLRKLKQFQDLGHKIVLIIGDFTAQIGDPSGRSEERKPLTKKEIEKNLKNYLSQAGKILDIKKVEVRRNSEWHGGKLFGTNLIRTAQALTLQQVIERDDFQKRIKSGQKVSMLETLYPLLQGYDSVAIRADVELGGTDQTFNLLAGRKVQRGLGVSEQDILTVPLIEGTDGVRKMSKSFGNYIALNDPPAEMFGKIMSIKDNLIIKYFELCTDVLEKKIKEFQKLLKAKKLNPRDAKMILAFEVVALYHGKARAKAASEEFERVFKSGGLPDRIPQIKLKKKRMGIAELLVEIGFAPSKSAATRLVEQGGVRTNGDRITNPKAIIEIPKTGLIIRAGKRKFAEVRN